MAEVLCLGEILVDWVSTELGAELEAARSFTKAPGGAPANVAVGLARQGCSTGFIGRVAADAFGRWLKSILDKEGVDTRGTIIDNGAQTRMAYVVTTASGDRKLAEFSRVSVADARLNANDLVPEHFAAAKVLHFGSISLIDDPASEATRAAIALARRHDLLVSYDPNVRLGLWPSPEACKQTILGTLPLADFVKINLDELEFLTGRRDLDAAAELRRDRGILILVVTLDSAGAAVFSKDGSASVPGFDIELVEATGAGDGFVAGMLAGFLAHLPESGDRAGALAKLALPVLVEITRAANAIGALTCTRAGAIPALPTVEELEAFIQRSSRTAAC